MKISFGRGFLSTSLAAVLILLSLPGGSLRAFPSSSISMFSQTERTDKIQEIMNILSKPEAKPHLALINMDLDKLEMQLASLDDLQLAMVSEKIDSVKAAGDAGTGIIITLLVIAILAVILIILLDKDIDVVDEKK